MNCPKCQGPREMLDRICRQCKYFFEEDRVLDLAPPRKPSGFGRLPQVKIPGRSLLIVLAAVVPGCGHMLKREWIRGLVFLGIVCVLIALSVWKFSTTFGQICFGLAVSAHTYSILDLTPWRRMPSPFMRGGIMILLLCVLMVAYWPLLALMADLLIPVNSRTPGRGEQVVHITDPLTPDRIFALAILFAATLVFSVWIRRRLTRES